jgi:hypothetical protein
MFNINNMIANIRLYGIMDKRFNGFAANVDASSIHAAWCLEKRIVTINAMDATTMAMI